MSGIRCGSYTHARRFPLVIGRIGGWSLPTPLTPLQAAVLLGLAMLELATARWWAVLPGAADLVVAMLLPALAAWAVRHPMVEGRRPSAVARGALTYLLRPRCGTRPGGRRTR